MRKRGIDTQRATRHTLPRRHLAVAGLGQGTEGQEWMPAAQLAKCQALTVKQEVVRKAPLELEYERART